MWGFDSDVSILADSMDSLCSRMNLDSPGPSMANPSPDERLAYNVGYAAEGLMGIATAVAMLGYCVLHLADEVSKVDLSVTVEGGEQ